MLAFCRTLAGAHHRCYSVTAAAGERWQGHTSAPGVVGLPFDDLTASGSTHALDNDELGRCCMHIGERGAQTVPGRLATRRCYTHPSEDRRPGSNNAHHDARGFSHGCASGGRSSMCISIQFQLLVAPLAPLICFPLQFIPTEVVVIGPMVLVTAIAPYIAQEVIVLAVARQCPMPLCDGCRRTVPWRRVPPWPRNCACPSC